MRKVVSKDGLGVYASADTLFRGAVFGRDSLEVAEDLMYTSPRLVHRIILTLASLQGEEDHKTNEEEPGKIVHEYRRTTVDGKPIDSISAEIFRNLSERWGGGADEMVYYGSVDSTPLFVRVLGKYCAAYGPEILTEKVIMRSGHQLSVALALENSLDWILRKLEASSSGLLEFKRKNPRGIENQVWKDSKEFYIHEDGTHANHSKPIASIEVQALAYDALRYGAELLPSYNRTLSKQAEILRDKTIGLLWRPDEQYFSLGLDYDSKNRQRIIKTLTANPGEMLDSRFFDELSPKDQQFYVSETVREIMGLEFLTDAGIRSRALSEARLVPFWDYHGSFTSWPKESYDIAKGLRRWGLPMLAEELENRLLNVVRSVRSYPEFIYVDARGRVLGLPKPSHNHGDLVLVDSHNKPEKIQAWTVSAILGINAQRGFLPRRRRVHQTAWQKELEAEVLRAIPRVKRLRTARELAARYPDYPYVLTQERRQ